MLTKTTIALSALLALGSASTALAYEYRVGDKYPFLEQTVQQRQQGASAFASTSGQIPVKPFTAQERALFDRATALASSY